MQAMLKKGPSASLVLATMVKRRWLDIRLRKNLFATIKRTTSVVNIQATTESVVYVVSLSDYLEYLNTGPEEQRFRHKAAEALFEMVYMRLLESYCDTPEQRYVKLMQRCPNLKEKVPLKEIASFLGVTPETVSHIRKKLSYPEKS